MHLTLYYNTTAMNYNVDFLKIKSEIESTACPVHNIRPLVKLENGQVTMRCCCDRFTSKCMAEVDKKLNNSNSILNIIDAWEQDLFVNELRMG